MSFAREFLWLFSQAFRGCFVTPLLWVPLFLFGGLTVRALLSQSLSERTLWKHHWWIFLTQSLFYPSIVLVGVLSEEFRGTNSLYFELGIYSSLAISAVIGAVGIYRMKGAWSPLFLVVTQQFVLLGAASVVGMAISGDWL